MCVWPTLTGDLALELGKAQQHIEGQPSYAVGGVERLRDTDERDIVAIDGLDDPGKVHQAAGQPVDLVDHDDIDPALPDAHVAGGEHLAATGEDVLSRPAGQPDTASDGGDDALTIKLVYLMENGQFT